MKSRLYRRSFSSNRRMWSIILISLWFSIWAAIAGLALFSAGAFTIGGIPANIAFKFFTDPRALVFLVTGNKTALHNRLEARGFEEDIKAYYRPRIADERELDRYIHQLFYNLTGYIGKDYTLAGNGQLVLKRWRSNLQ
jgi:hypothetical protein